MDIAAVFSLVDGDFFFFFLITENTDKVAEKLEELSVKDKTSEEKKKEEKKGEEGKEVTADEKN